jgi:hypothetical protein
VQDESYFFHVALVKMKTTSGHKRQRKLKSKEERQHLVINAKESQKGVQDKSSVLHFAMVKEKTTSGYKSQRESKRSAG